jgi:hypothetical protein
MVAVLDQEKGGPGQGQGGKQEPQDPRRTAPQQAVPTRDERDRHPGEDDPALRKLGDEDVGGKDHRRPGQQQRCYRRPSLPGRGSL